MNAVSNQTLALIAGLTYLLSTVYVFKIAHKRSGFSWILLVYEYFYIIGLGFGSIYLAFNTGADDDFFRYYILSNGPISNSTFIHIILYSAGMFLGVIVHSRKRIGSTLHNPITTNKFDEIKEVYLYRATIYISILLLITYITSVGLEVALTTAGKARTGFTEGLEEATIFLFLKKLAQIGSLSIIFFPLIILRKKSFFDTSIFFVYGISLYILTGARAAISDTLMFGFFIYFSRGKINTTKIILLAASIFFAIIFTLYGKGLGDELFSYLFGIKTHLDELKAAELDALLSQFIHLTYSIDSGIKSFTKNGPIITDAILLAPIGIFPNWLFTSLGLDWLNWKNLSPNENLVCINTMSFPLAKNCTIPPYYLGAAAYLGPLLFGLIFGFIKFYLISSISLTWQKLSNYPTKLWKPLLSFILLERLSLFIPDVIAFISFLSLLALAFFLIRAFIKNTLLKNIY